MGPDQNPASQLRQEGWRAASACDVKTLPFQCIQAALRNLRRRKTAGGWVSLFYSCTLLKCEVPGSRRVAMHLSLALTLEGHWESCGRSATTVPRCGRHGTGGPWQGQIVHVVLASSCEAGFSAADLMDVCTVCPARFAKFWHRHTS